MKRILFVLFLVLPFLSQAQLEKQLTKTIQLVMPKTANDSTPGTRGAAVVWHPVQKKYYAAFAGNSRFPMAVFDENGKRLSDDNLATMQDLRGLWYNTKTKMITGNGFSDIGWFTYSLDAKGIPVKSEVYAAGKNQPGDHNVGTYNPKATMYISSRGNLYMYIMKKECRKRTAL